MGAICRAGLARCRIAGIGRRGRRRHDGARHRDGGRRPPHRARAAARHDRARRRRNRAGRYAGAARDAAAADRRRKALVGVLSRGTRRRLRPRLRARSRKGGRQRLRHRWREDLRTRRACGGYAGRLRAHGVGQGAGLPFPRSAHRQRRPAQCRAGARRPAGRDGQPCRCEGRGGRQARRWRRRTCSV